MAREVLSNGVINPDKYQADWYADLSNNWNLLNNLIGSAISSSEVDSKIATAIQELMVRTFQIVAELPATGTEGVMYLVLIPNTSKYTAYVWENNAYRELGVIQMTITIDDELSTTSENPAQNKVITNALNNKAPISHTHSASDITSGLATVATSGSYNDLSNKPTIPTVNNATLTIQKNGTNVQTFTANQSTNATANITVPTKTSDLTNDSGFITSDDTKIPLAGSNAISGSLIPSTDGTVNLGGPQYQWNNAYIKSLTINGVACGDILTHNASEFVDVTGNQTIDGTKIFSNLRTYFGRDVSCCSRSKYGRNLNPTSTSYQYLNFGGNTVSDGSTNDWGSGYLEQVVNTDGSSRGRWFVQDTSENAVGLELWASGDDKQLRPYQNGNTDLGTSTKKWRDVNTILLNGKTPAYNDDVVPRSGGAVMTGNLAKNVDDSYFEIKAGPNGGGLIGMNGKNHPDSPGTCYFLASDGVSSHIMILYPSGTWTWNGSAVQLVSDQRLKQQITEIDDALLDAWEDVELSQFKYNDAVDQKGDNARLHTGYVIQQIDKACQSHGVDISAYGLYCHEEYPEETEEVEVEQKDGTKTKEKKVIREASEHYSLRYTEALIVECAYLRKCIKELRTEIEQLKSSK